MEMNQIIIIPNFQVRMKLKLETKKQTSLASER